jgi:hypothetical protein
MRKALTIMTVVATMTAAPVLALKPAIASCWECWPRLGIGAGLVGPVVGVDSSPFFITESLHQLSIMQASMPHG